MDINHAISTASHIKSHLLMLLSASQHADIDRYSVHYAETIRHTQTLSKILTTIKEIPSCQPQTSPRTLSRHATYVSDPATASSPEHAVIGAALPSSPPRPATTTPAHGPHAPSATRASISACVPFNPYTTPRHVHRSCSACRPSGDSAEELAGTFRPGTVSPG